MWGKKELEQPAYGQVATVTLVSKLNNNDNGFVSFVREEICGIKY